MTIKLSPWQTKVWDDIHRFIVISAGRRTGKTTLSALKIIDFASHNPQSITWYVAPSYKQSEQIMWRILQQFLPPGMVLKTNDTKLQIYLKNGAIIELKGADTNPDSLRGVRIDYLVLDEVAMFKNWETVWGEVLRPTLIDSKGKALFISTPKGFNHFYELFNSVDPDYHAYKFTSYDNPYLDAGEIDKARLELTEDTFQQEFNADFRTYTGLVHRPWDRTIHLIEPFSIPSTWTAVRGFDYGSTHPTASVRFRIDNDFNWFLDRSYKQTNKPIAQHAASILAQDYKIPITAIYGDPSGAQWATEFAQHNLNIVPADKHIGQQSRTWVEFCVDKVNEKLEPIPGKKAYLPDGRVIENAPSLFVFDTSENRAFVKEVEGLQWNESASGSLISILDETTDPEGHFDLMASTRYAAVSHKKMVIKKHEKPDWATDTPSWSG